MADASSPATTPTTPNGAAAPATPAPAGQPPATPPAPEASRQARQTRTYQTAPKTRGTPATPPAAPSAPEVRSATPPSANSGAAASGADSAAGGAEGGAGVAADAPADGAAAAAATEAAKDPATLTEEEGARRLAAISRAERRFAEEKRTHGDRLAIADAVAQVLPNANPRQVQQALGQLRQLHDARAAAAKDPVGFLQRVFGVDPQVTRQLAIDGVLGEAAKTPAQKEAERVAALEERQKAYEQRIAQEDETRKAAEVQRAAGEYQKNVLAPLFSDPANPKAFENIRTFCAINGQDPARELYNAMVVRFQATGRTPDPKALAEELEALLQPRLASLRAANANPAQQADRKRAEPPQAPPPGSRRVTPTADKAAGGTGTPPEFRRPRANGKPYTAKPM